MKGFIWWLLFICIGHHRASGVQFSGKEISEKRNGAERLRERIAGCAAFNNHGAGAQVLIKALLAQVDGAHEAWISCIKFGLQVDGPV